MVNISFWKDREILDSRISLTTSFKEETKNKNCAFKVDFELSEQALEKTVH